MNNCDDDASQHWCLVSSMLVLSCLQPHERTLHTPFGFIELMGSAEDLVKHAVGGVITIKAHHHFTVSFNDKGCVVSRQV